MRKTRIVKRNFINFFLITLFTTFTTIHEGDRHTMALIDIATNSFSSIYPFIKKFRDSDFTTLADNQATS